MILNLFVRGEARASPKSDWW